MSTDDEEFTKEFERLVRGYNEASENDRESWL